MAAFDEQIQPLENEPSVAKTDETSNISNTHRGDSHAGVASPLVNNNDIDIPHNNNNNNNNATTINNNDAIGSNRINYLGTINTNKANSIDSRPLLSESIQTPNNNPNPIPNPNFKPTVNNSITISSQQFDQIIKDNQKYKRISTIAIIISILSLISSIYIALNPNSISNAVKHNHNNNNHHHHNSNASNWTNITNGTFIPTPTFAPINYTTFYPTQQPTQYNPSYHDIGDFKLSFKNNNHGGWLLCNGATYQISKFELLYQEIGQSFRYDNATYNQSIYFQIPRVTGVAVGVAGMFDGVAYAPSNTLYGSKSVTLEDNNLPDHSHSVCGCNFGYDNGIGSAYGLGGISGDACASCTNSKAYPTKPTNSNTTAFSVVQPTKFFGYLFIYSGVDL